MYGLNLKNAVFGFYQGSPQYTIQRARKLAGTAEGRSSDCGPTRRALAVPGERS